MKIIVPDMGRGNCIGIFDKDSAPVLVDCGTMNKSKVHNFTNLVEKRIKKTNNRNLIITHYHFDHYSLIRNFPHKFFNNIYLPALPKESSAANVMLKFLALATVVRLKKYYLTPIILSRAKNVHCLVKGEGFNIINRDWEVLWPDYQIVDKRNRRKIKTVLKKINEVKQELTDEQAQEFDKLYDQLSGAFAGQLEELDNIPKEIPQNNERISKIQNALASVEEVFRDIANRASLVVRDEFIDFLFTGDIDEVILNNELDFGNHQHFLIEAPHHGGYYGYAFDNLSTEILVISRRANYKPNCRFFRNLPWTILIDTAKNGNCIVQSKHPRKVSVAYSTTTPVRIIYT